MMSAKFFLTICSWGIIVEAWDIRAGKVSMHGTENSSNGKDTRI